MLGVVFVLSASVYAMTFSQPIKIEGRIGSDCLNDGFCVENPTHNSGNLIKVKKPLNKRQYYDKGVAQFGNGQDAIYAHYNMYNDKQNVYFGGQDIKNTFPLFVTVNWQGEEIYKITTSDNITMYMIFTGFDVPGDVSYYFLGRLQDGKWVKYIDTDEIRNNYFGKSNVVWSKPKINNDTITISYQIVTSPWRPKYIGNGGEFRFKWDETAQWFGIEQVVY